MVKNHWKIIVSISGSGSSPKSNQFVLVTHPTCPPLVEDVFDTRIFYNLNGRQSTRRLSLIRSQNTVRCTCTSSYTVLVPSLNKIGPYMSEKWLRTCLIPGFYFYNKNVRKSTSGPSLIRLLKWSEIYMYAIMYCSFTKFEQNRTIHVREMVEDTFK